MTSRLPLSPITTTTKEPQDSRGLLPNTQLPIDILETAYHWYIYQPDYKENNVSRFCNKVLDYRAETKETCLTISQLNELVILLAENIKDSQTPCIFNSAFFLDVFLACALTTRHHDDRPLYSIQDLQANKETIHSSCLCSWRSFYKKIEILETYKIATPENISAVLTNSRLSLFLYQNMLKKYPGISQTIFNVTFFIHDYSISNYCFTKKLDESQCKLLCDYIISKNITHFNFRGIDIVHKDAQRDMRTFLTHFLCATKKTDPVPPTITSKIADPGSSSSLGIFARDALAETQLLPEILNFANIMSWAKT